MRRIGYLVPEFPGQTHAFFWRELKRLKELGVEGRLISTRPPPAGLVCHAWSQEAISATHYLTQPGATLAAQTTAAVARHPLSWARCLSAIPRAEGLTAKGRGRLAALALMGVQLAVLAKNEGFSHVHVHSAADAAHVAMFARLFGGPSYSLTLHGPVSDYGPNQKQKWQHAAFGIVITQRLLGEMQRDIGAGFLPKLEVAPMGVDVDAYVRSSDYQPWQGTGPLKIFSCGRLNPVKGHAELAEAVCQLRQRGMDVRLRIAGQDDAGGQGYRSTLLERLRSLGAGDAVELIGAVPESQVRAELEGAHLFALASHHEPLGVAIMEAMALSLPVVVTSAGGVPELVDDGIDGLLVPPKEPARMAEAISQLANDPTRAVELGRKARSKVEQSFDSGRSAKLIAELSSAAK